MGVADHLPDEPVGLGKTDHREGVVLVALRHIDGHVFIEPIVAAGDIGHPAEGLEDGVAVLADKEFVELLGGVGGGAVVVVLGRGGRPRSRQVAESRAAWNFIRVYHPNFVEKRQLPLDPPSPDSIGYRG